MKRKKKYIGTILAVSLSMVLLGEAPCVFPAVMNASAETEHTLPENTDTATTETIQNVEQVQKLAADLLEKNRMAFDGRSGGFSWDTEGKSYSWTYYNGIMMDAYLMMEDLLNAGNNTSVSTYSTVDSFYDANISFDGTNVTAYNYKDGELDSIPPMRALFDLLRSDVPTEEEREKYTRMILSVYELMTERYPTVEGTDGNFRHKTNSSWENYPVALDGLYMAQPFFMEFANSVEDGTIQTDKMIDTDGIYSAVTARMCWVGENLYDAEKELYNHGWGPKNGTNGQFWLRAVGWYAASLADVISMLPERCAAEREKLITIEKRLFDGMIKYQDAETGMWYNVIDHDGTLKGSKSVNKPESSGTVLIAYAMLRSYTEGYLDESYCRAGLRAFNGTVEAQLDNEGLHSIYISSGVGTTPESYLSKAYKINEAKGVGPLMMAACFAKRAVAVTPCYNFGDVNADGEFNIGDLVLLEKWLLNVTDTQLANWKAADLNADNRLSVDDLRLMEKALVCK